MAQVLQATGATAGEELPAAQATVAGPLAEVEARLGKLAAGMPEQLRAVTGGLLRAGKRLRPLVVLLAAGEGQSAEGAAVALATAVEEVHVASLIHDDVIDGAERRRGHVSAPAALGQRCAVLAGDYLAAAAYQQIMGADVAGAPDALIEAVVRMTLAEVQELATTGRLLSEAEHLQIISGKTAALFEVSAYLGGLAADLPPDDLEGLRRYGAALGMAFQIRDDLLDLYGEAGDLGKPVRTDLAEGIYTLPVIAAAGALGGQAVRDRLEQLYAGAGNGHLAAEIATLARCLGGQAYASQRMEQYAQDAMAALPADLPGRSHLEALAHYAVHRCV
jgi:geranylgeranyl pyrophosphate synthase